MWFINPLGFVELIGRRRVTLSIVGALAAVGLASGVTSRSAAGLDLQRQSPIRGRLANEGFYNQRMKGVFFFAGNWRLPAGNPMVPDPGCQRPLQFYEYPLCANSHVYTVWPSDSRHLGWSESREHREFALEQMLAVGTNVIVMSYWGEPGSDRWAHYAPMHTSTQAHDQLFDAAADKDVLIMPAIESANGTVGCGGHSQAFQFAGDFPRVNGQVAPQLVSQVVDLVTRYIKAPRNPVWPSKWAKMFDREGRARYAINILHVASSHLRSNEHEAFARGFDEVAELVHAKTGVLVGFTLDVIPIGRPEITSGDCRGWQRWFEIHPETRAGLGAPVSAVWTSERHLDLFMAGPDGTVFSTWWDEAEPAGYGPQGWFAIHPETKAAPGTAVTAVWRQRGHLDLFMTARDGTVWSIWWDEAEPAGYRPQGWFAIHPETKAASGAPVTAIWQHQGHLDLFVTARDGTVWSIWWDEAEPAGYRPQGWFAIHPETKAASGAPVTAVSRHRGHLDLFVTDPGGRVLSTWWNEAEPAGYRPQGWFAIHPETKVAAGAAVTALWASDRHLDLFATGSDGIVQSIWWDKSEPAGYRPQGWFAIRPHPANKAHRGAPVTALWRDGGQLDLFTTAPDGTIISIIWRASDPNGYSPGWFPIQPELKTPPGSRVTALWKDHEHQDLFVAGTDGAVRSTWWQLLADTYVARPAITQRALSYRSAVLAIQGFLPEVRLDPESDDLSRVIFKREYLQDWLEVGTPVIMDVASGYDGRKVFLGSAIWGNNPVWRASLTNLWDRRFAGVVFNAWNGYTEGTTAVPAVPADRFGTANYEWLRQLFQMAAAAP